MTQSLSVLIPTYRNPLYLDTCLRSLTDNRASDLTNIIVIVDGFVDESRSVIAKYSGIQVIELEHNMGMAHALNVGVWNASTELICIANDDNVFPAQFDARLQQELELCQRSPNHIVTLNQIEPLPSLYNFHTCDLGTDVSTFQYDTFLEYEQKIQTTKWTLDGRIFPFLMRKADYMKLGGFDTWYQSPFFVDIDFWLKAELAHCSFLRTHQVHLYHFGSKATKFGTEATRFKQSESVAAEQFQYKWGYLPNIGANVQRNNTKYPSEIRACINGIRFE